LHSFARQILGIVAAFSVGCAGGTPGPATTTEPLPPPPPLPFDAGPQVPTATTASAAPVSVDAGPAPADEPTTNEPACGGADVDLATVLANKRCRAHRDAAPTPPSAAADVKVTLAPSATKVAPGGHVDLALELVNTGGVTIPLYFSGDLTLSVEVKDAKGVRVTPPPGNAPKNADPKCVDVNCRLPSSHVVLPPGGKAHARVGWDAVKTAWPTPGPTTCCTIHVEPVGKGPLAVGAYRVKVPLPFEATQGNPADQEVEIRVGK
jgi:Protein of unknown function (DUF4232)